MAAGSAVDGETGCDHGPAARGPEPARGKSMDKSFDPKPIESKWYARWEADGLFAPSGDGQPYCILLPPPNVTGTLHMGHAFQMTLMDALIRYNRMRGRRTRLRTLAPMRAFGDRIANVLLTAPRSRECTSIRGAPGGGEASHSGPRRA